MISIFNLVESLFDSIAARIYELPEPVVILLLFLEASAIRKTIRFYRWTCRDDDKVETRCRICRERKDCPAIDIDIVSYPCPYYIEDQEFRCHTCREKEDCPTFDAGPIYPCPDYKKEEEA